MSDLHKQSDYWFKDEVKPVDSKKKRIQVLDLINQPSTDDSSQDSDYWFR